MKQKKCDCVKSVEKDVQLPVNVLLYIIYNAYTECGAREGKAMYYGGDKVKNMNPTCLSDRYINIRDIISWKAGT